MGLPRRQVALALVLVASLTRADDRPLAGAKLLVQDPTGDPARRKLGMTAAAGSPAIAQTPLAAGADLSITAHGGTASAQTFSLPAAGWRPLGTAGFKYSNTTVGGPVRSVTLRRNGRGVVTLKLSIRGQSGPVDVVPPNPGDDASVVLAITGGDTYCAAFGGTAGGDERRDDGRSWLVRKAAPAPCPLPPTTTTTTDTSTTSSTSTSEPTSSSTLTATSSTTTATTDTTTTTSAPTTTATTATTTSSTSTTTATTATTTSSTTATTATTTTDTTTTSTTATTTATTATTTSSTTATTLPPTTTSSTTSTTSSTTTTTLVLELNLLYVHGLKSCPGSRMNAQGSLTDLESAVNAALPARIAAWEAAHPGVHVVAHSARANVYTAPASGIHPSDSPDPLNMDDWEVGDPGCSTTQQGEPCTTAYEWRFRLAEEVNRLFPAPAKNVILIGHSNGARAAMEVAANTGPGGVNTHDWGVQSRIAGVVTVQGVIDAIGSSKYNVVGIASFESSCKNGDAISGFGDSCAPGNGFCEWVGRVDASPAADWVARNKRALMLTAWGSCSPSAWTGRSDGSLPYDAQASPWAVGLDMTPAPGETWRQVHGERYGAFCHSDITDASKPNHAAARDAARNRLLDWLFVAAPRVAATGSNSTPSIAFNQSSATFTMGSTCPAGEVDDAITSGTKGPGVDVVGVCKHPGFFDGDDHAIAASEFTVTNGATCNGTYRWTQAHDSNDNHAATFWWKTRSLRAASPELLGSLPID